MRVRKEDLRNAYPIVAKALGNKFKVNVRIGGDQAKTDGSMIFLPAIEPESETDRNALWGYLAHESAHVRWTDHAVFRGYSAQGPIYHSILNKIEDARIERALARLYPGTRATINYAIAESIRSGAFSAVEASDPPAHVVTGYVLYAARARILGQPACDALAQSAGAALSKLFDPGFVSSLDGLLEEIKGLESTSDAAKLSDRIIDLIKSQQQPPPQADESRGSDPSESDTGDDDEEDESQGSESSGSNTGDDDRADESQGSEASESGIDDDDRADESQVSDASESNTGDDDGEDGSQGSEASKAILSADESDMTPDPFDIIKQTIQSMPESEDEAFPEMVLKHRDRDAGMALYRKVVAESRRLRAQLHGLVQSERMEHNAIRNSGRRISARHLCRAATHDGRIFRHRGWRTALNTAVHLLVDRSGSMCRVASNHARIDLAIEAAMALALALEGMDGVTSAVTAFPGDVPKEDQVLGIMRRSERVKAVVQRFPIFADGWTPLTGALWYCAAELLMQSRERRILIVLTDGQPDDRVSAATMLSRCGKSGIEVIGIGLQHDVSGLFENSLNITDFRDLKRKLFTIAKELLAA